MVEVLAVATVLTAMSVTIPIAVIGCRFPVVLLFCPGRVLWSRFGLESALSLLYSIDIYAE